MELVFLTIAGILGLIFAMMGGVIFFRSIFPGNWDKVMGHIEKVVIEETNDGVDKPRFRGRVEYIYVYLAVLRHGYTYVGYSSFTRSDVKEELSSYHLGQCLEIYVYKKIPSISTLTPGINYSSFACMIFGIALIAFSLYQTFIFAH